MSNFEFSLFNPGLLLPENFNKFRNLNVTFGNFALVLVVVLLLVKLPLTTSAEVPGSNPGHG